MGKEQTMKSALIFQAADPLDEKLVEWERLVSERETEASLLVVRLRDVKVELGRFLNEYNARVGTLYATQDQIRLGIKEYLFRLDALKHATSSMATFKNVEETVSKEFAEERRKAEDVKREASDSSEHYQKEQEEGQRQVLDRDDEEELKKLYRKLVQKYHPDLTRDETLREKHSAIMAAINEAYEKRDLEALRNYMLESEREEEIARETLLEKIARLKDYYTGLLSTIAGLESELEATLRSDTHALWEKVDTAKKEGRDLLQEIADKIQAEILTDTKTLNQLLVRYKRRLTTVEPA